MSSTIHDTPTELLDYPDYPDAYPYKDLKPGEIRLMYLRGGDVSTQLHCHLVLANLDSDPPPTYMTLSYCWGEPGDMSEFPILLNGHEVYLSRNLMSALVNLRLGDGMGDLLIWIDAVCINQKDAEERSRQVRLMRRLFENAIQVLGWIGPHANDSLLAIKKLKALYEAFSLRIKAHGSIIAALANLTLEDIYGGPEPIEAEWYALHHFFNREWWFRLWVLQEATTENPTTLVCGNELLPMEGLYKPSLLLSDVAARPGMGWLGPAAIGGNTLTMKFLEKRGAVKGPLCHLLSLLQDARRSDCTDPRDQIFAMLGFANDITPEELVPDYKVAVCDLYTFFVIWYIRKYRNLDVLGSCTQPDSNRYKLPSWVPDWMHRSHMKVLPKRLASTDDAKLAFDATLGSQVELLENYSIGKGPRPQTLHLDGIYIATIGTVLEVATDNVSAAIEASWSPPFGLYPAPYALTRESVGQVFRRTLVVDLKQCDGYEFQQRGAEMVWPDGPPTWKPVSVEQRKAERDAMIALKDATQGRRLFYTDAGEAGKVVVTSAVTDGTETTVSEFELGNEGAGLMGLGSSGTQVGDHVFLLKGGRVPFVLHPVKTEADLDGGGSITTEYRFVGECYVHGLMDGQALEMIGHNPSRQKPDALQRMGTEWRTVVLV